MIIYYKEIQREITHFHPNKTTCFRCTPLEAPPLLVFVFLQWFGKRSRSQEVRKSVKQKVQVE